MKRMLAALAVAAALAGPAAAAAPRVAVRVDRTEIVTAIGHKFRFRSTIVNRGQSRATGLIAHLNVLSLRTGTYVDPEDWSSNRTRYLAALPPGGAVTIDWRLQAVNSGDFGVYVAVLPRRVGPFPPAVGPTIGVAVAKRATLNSGGILPLAVGIPAALAAVMLTLRLRRRRAR